MRAKGMLMVGWLSILIALTATGTPFAATPYHLDKNIMSTGCASCHRGFDFSDGGGSYKCVTCHGANSSLSLQASRLQLKNVAKEFAKNYRHPSFDKKNTHNAKEVLPETNQAAPRHAECADCHSPHFVSSDKPFAGLKGKKTGNFNAPITKEYELCYLCHADSANLPVKSTNKRLDFNPSNPSFHPVEAEGKNLQVISLLRPYREKKGAANDISIIKCGDCHASDDPTAARGPHGSKYQGLLVENFSTGDNLVESSYAYALCYRCHKRELIINNPTLAFHGKHITGTRDGIANFKGGGTSCYTCHTSHGSSEYRYLIRFNRDYVTESSSGQLKFVEKGTYSFHGECYLTCHGVDHNPKTY